MAAESAALEVDGATHRLVARGATALRMTHKDLIAEAVREYLANRRYEVNAQLRAVMSRIDDSASSQVVALTSLSPERLSELGGIRE